jgi:hypothetical protein
MADDLEENFEIGDEFMPSTRPQEVNSSEEEEEEIEEVNKPTTNKRKQPPTAEAPSKKKKRKNITEILELKKSEMSKASFATREFIKILSEYAQKKLSGVEKNELNLGGDIDSRLGDMILKRKKTHRLEVGEQFKKKFVKKLRYKIDCKRQNQHSFTHILGLDLIKRHKTHLAIVARHSS